MDIDALHSALLSITVVSEKVRAAREILSATGDAPAPLVKFLYEAENDLRMSQATLGGELGFSLCPRCWPPELVATDLDGKLNCPVCGRISYEQAARAARKVKSDWGVVEQLIAQPLRSAQQSRYCRSHAFAQMGT